MTSLEEMIRILQPLGIYRLEEGTAVYRELQTYAGAMDRCRETLDEILREAIVQTAVSYGLDYREQLFGPRNEALNAEERRKRLIYRLSVLPGDFTRSGISRALLSFGYQGEIREEKEKETLLFEPIGESTDPADYLELIEGLRQILPVHLRFSFTIAAPTWAELDAGDETFAVRDAKAVPWDFYMDA